MAKFILFTASMLDEGHPTGESCAPVTSAGDAMMTSDVSTGARSSCYMCRQRSKYLVSSFGFLTRGNSQKNKKE